MRLLRVGILFQFENVAGWAVSTNIAVLKTNEIRTNILWLIVNVCFISCRQMALWFGMVRRLWNSMLIHHSNMLRFFMAQMSHMCREEGASGCLSLHRTAANNCLTLVLFMIVLLCKGSQAWPMLRCTKRYKVGPPSYKVQKPRKPNSLVIVTTMIGSYPEVIPVY